MSRPDDRARPTRRDLENVLRVHVLGPWFPRCLDRDHGGFLCDFDRSWRDVGPHDKLAEFQARQTIVAAEASLRYPRDPALKDATLCGFQGLRDGLWDREHGGWYHRCDRSWRPLEGASKHVHGMAYGITACVAVHRATGDASALTLANAAFDWMDAHAHDARHGGYLGFLERDGRRVRGRAELPPDRAMDTIGVPLDHKDANVHTDLLESLTFLYVATKRAIVRERLVELARIVATRMVQPDGALPFIFRADWTPVGHLVRHGYQFQAAHRLLRAGVALGRPRAFVAVARRAVDHALRNAWDAEAGGFAYATPATPPFVVEEHDVSVRARIWWPQFEALRALGALDAAGSGNTVHGERVGQLWAIIKRSFLDAERTGFLTVDPASLEPTLRRRVASGRHPWSHKGTVWKDASHESRALMFLIDALRGTQRVRLPRASA